jgi:maltokinase
MLRSFDYAARQRRPWRPEWARRCREAFCAGYAERAGWDPRKKHALLRAYETDRAVYEVLYEARHRPDWLPVPMAAIERLAVRGG